LHDEMMDQNVQSRLNSEWRMIRGWLRDLRWPYILQRRAAVCAFQPTSCYMPPRYHHSPSTKKRRQLLFDLKLDSSFPSGVGSDKKTSAGPLASNFRSDFSLSQFQKFGALHVRQASDRCAAFGCSSPNLFSCFLAVFSPPDRK
jgi:hypothetical protein